MTERVSKEIKTFRKITPTNSGNKLCNASQCKTAHRTKRSTLQFLEDNRVMKMITVNTIALGANFRHCIPGNHSYISIVVKGCSLCFPLYILATHPRLPQTTSTTRHPM